jgi:hypothetical protein
LGTLLGRSVFTSIYVLSAANEKDLKEVLNGPIMYLEGYLDGGWMNILTILCMANV